MQPYHFNNQIKQYNTIGNSHLFSPSVYMQSENLWSNTICWDFEAKIVKCNHHEKCTQKVNEWSGKPLAYSWWAHYNFELKEYMAQISWRTIRHEPPHCCDVIRGSGLVTAKGVCQWLGSCYDDYKGIISKSETWS